MAEPKKRTNSSKQGMRRMHDKVIAPALNYCTNCHEAKKAHEVCPSCGFYNNVKVSELNKDKKDKE